MPVSDAHKKASAKWNSSHDNIMLRPDKETGAAIRAAASAAGLSVQQFILKAVEKFMKNKDYFPGGIPPGFSMVDSPDRIGGKAVFQSHFVSCCESGVSHNRFHSLIEPPFCC